MRLWPRPNSWGLGGFGFKVERAITSKDPVLGGSVLLKNDKPSSAVSQHDSCFSGLLMLGVCEGPENSESYTGVNLNLKLFGAVFGESLKETRLT